MEIQAGDGWSRCVFTVSLILFRVEDGACRLPRLTQFVTFMPKKFRMEKARQGKIRSVLAGCSNNHWAALASRVPIVPFPPWSAKAKSIPKIIPSFVSHSAIASPSSRENEEEEEEEGRERKRQRTSKRSSTDNDDEPLPDYILDLL